MYVVPSVHFLLGYVLFNAEADKSATHCLYISHGRSQLTSTASHIVKGTFAIKF